MAVKHTLYNGINADVAFYPLNDNPLFTKQHH
jgi:hypothetical protein